MSAPNPEHERILSAHHPGSRLDLALSAWRSVLGLANVSSDDATLRRYARSSSCSSRRPAAVLTPASRDEVVEVVRIARRHRTPLYPISTGRNWGYGDACAVHGGQVIVDLGRLDRIRRVDAELGVAVIEPGVTQRQLAEHLSHHQVPFWVDCTGASPDSSLVGNVMERGFGHTPYGDRFRSVAGLEVVLGTGEVLHTGFGRFPGAKTTHLYPYGVGPYLDGIFTQANFGIVTQLGLWLLPVPESFCPFIVVFRNNEDLLRALEPLRRLRQQRVLESVAHIGNDLRTLAADRSFPRDRVSVGARVPAEVRAAMRRETGLGAWGMSGAFYGPSRSVSAAKRELRKALAGVRAKVTFLTPTLLATGRLVGGLTNSRAGQRLYRQVEVASALADLHRGKPNGTFLRGAYWRSRGGLPADFSESVDLADEGLGLRWIAPILPFRREDVELVNAEMDKTFAGFGFDCHVTISMISDRALAAIYTVYFDTEDTAEIERGVACYDTALSRLLELGYPPYRASITSMGALSTKRTGVSASALLKRALDPDDIIAPGRYDEPINFSLFRG